MSNIHNQNPPRQNPLHGWMKAVLWLAGAAYVLQGVCCFVFYRTLFAPLRMDLNNDSLFIQLTGVLLISLGLGLWLVLRNPLVYRPLLAFACAMLLLVGLLALSKINRSRLPVQFLPVVLFGYIGVLPALAIIAQRLFSFPNPPQPQTQGSLSLGLRTTAASTARRWLMPLAWCAFLVLLIAPTAMATRKVVREARLNRNDLPPLTLAGFKSNFPATAEKITPLVTNIAFRSLRFTDPTFITPMPGNTGELAVVERCGRIYAFDNNPGARNRRLFLDITDRTMKVPNRAEDGLFCIAFHPEYLKQDSPHAGECFVHYTADVEGKRFNRLSKFQLAPGANAIDNKSEVILIATPEREQSHNGGSVLFGPDGFLYLTLGDDGRRQPNPHAGYIDRDLFSGILRLDVNCTGGDVSHAPPRQPDNGKTAHYFIPNDNPFVGLPNALEEFYAIGLRNPWRATFDSQTGKLWVGDVGERRREQIIVVSNGSNCGWAFREGTVPTTSFDKRSLGKPEKIFGKETNPVLEYEHDAMCRCVIGGYVYRGKQFPELVGKYVYADQSGRIYALEADDKDQLISNKLIAVMDDPGLGISTFGEDSDGELFICIIKELAQESGEIHRLQPAPNDDANRLPRLLSETGLFTNLDTLKPAPGLNPYEITTPLWSDRAAKRRWIGIPTNQKITGEFNAQWKFPVGTVFIKQFDLPLDERVSQDKSEHPSIAEQTAHKVRRLETRVVVCDANNAVYAATYRWNQEQTDAELINESVTEDIEYTDEHGKAQKQTWLYPGRFECMACHNKPAGYVLGFNSKQLNRELTIAGKSGNQLRNFADSGMFAATCTPQQLCDLPHLVSIDDKSASLQDRARSYLDANCSSCHRPGHVFGGWDARFERPLELAEIVKAKAYMHGSEKVNAMVVEPGNAKESFLAIRVNASERAVRMPPLGRNLVDQKAAKLITDWINSLPPDMEGPANGFSED